MKAIYKITFSFTMVLIAIMTACSQNKNEKSKEGNMQESSFGKGEAENFDKFCESFYSDSLFQISRVIFPEPSDSIDSSSEDFDESTFPEFSKENWTILKSNVFQDMDSIINADGRVYKKSISKTTKSVIESIFIENSGCFTTLKFELIKGKWYLTDYIVSND